MSDRKNPRSEPAATAQAMLTREELASYLNVTKGWIDNAVSECRIPFVRLGHRTVRFRRGEIDEWLEAKCFRPGPVR